MPQAKDPALGINSWLEDELYHQYQFDRKSVDEGWTHLFEEAGQTVTANGSSEVGTNGDIAVAEPEAKEPSTPYGPETPRQEPPQQPPPETEPPQQLPPQQEPPQVEPPRQEPPQPTPAPQESLPRVATQLVTQAGPAAAPGAAEVTRTSSQPARQETKAVGSSDQLIPLRGAAARIAENMTASLAIPVATSQRQIPVRVIEENRNLINKQRALHGRGKLSFTHIIAWAIVKSVESNPALNQAYAENGGEPFRVVRGHVNIGLAVDVAGKDGSRSLKVPNVKNADVNELCAVRRGL